MAKDKKFISFDKAVNEILNDFRNDTQSDLFAEVYSLVAGGHAVAGEKECPPFGIELRGIWYQPSTLEERTFYSGQDFCEVLSKALISKKTSEEEICKIYCMVMCVEAYVGPGPFDDTGIWVETEMENFDCIQCGHCCLNLTDAFCTTTYEEDILRWMEEGRSDILEYIVAGDLWISPRTGRDVVRCPWLRKVPNKKKYICRIHDTKPKHCREYPKSKKHALKTGCQGFKIF